MGISDKFLNFSTSRKIETWPCIKKYRKIEIVWKTIFHAYFSFSNRSKRDQVLFCILFVHHLKTASKTSLYLCIKYCGSLMGPSTFYSLLSKPVHKNTVTLKIYQPTDRFHIMKPNSKVLHNTEVTWFTYYSQSSLWTNYFDTNQ